MKKKIFIILVALVFFIGGTYALIRKTVFTQNESFSISGLDAYIIYNKGTDVLSGTLMDTESYSDSTLNTEITLYKNASFDIYGHIYLDLKAIGANLANEKGLKWVITSNNKVLNSGNFIGYAVNDSIPLELNIPLSTTEQKFQIYVWIDEKVFENFNISTEQIGTTVRAEATQIPIEIEPNKPALVDGLIPVKYDSTNEVWVKADSTNTNHDWYNYNNKIWANAVLVSETNRNSYINGSVGTTIPESDVLAYYVWIPRYKYKVWNINKSTYMTNNLNAQTEGIDIVFEIGYSNGGTISCNYDFTITDGSLSEICTGSNGDYYTHPAFTFGNDEVTGFWVGKFEISSETPDVLTSNNYYGGGNVTNLTVRIKPNVRSWRYNTLTNFYKVIYDMQIENNIYGLNTSRSNTDSHMLKNMEWGAVAYLTNSKYGRCTNNTCTEVTINNSSDFITGNAGDTISAASSLAGVTNAYNTAKGQLASTTGNIYGVYDMSGGAFEYVMGNMSDVSGGYTYYASSGGSNYTYTGNEKYINTYSYGTSYNNQTAYNRARLGDATGESKSWYFNNTYIVSAHYSYSWFTRGAGYSNNYIAGLFNSDFGNGNTYPDCSARAALFAVASN